MIDGLLEARLKGNDEVDLDRALRPESFKDYIGQKDLINKLDICIEAAIQRNEPMDHILLFGPPGLGKTTIANIISKESFSGFRSVNAPSIKSTADLLEILTKLKNRDVLFIDEIHSLDKRIAELLYSAMEDFKVEIKLGNKEIVPIRIQPFCLIGATTAPGKISPPLRDRFGIIYTMQFYAPEELAVIVEANANKLKLEVTEPDALINLANRSRGTPRIANRLLRRVRDFAQVKNNNVLNNDCVNEAMALEGIDDIGISEADRKYLQAIYKVYNCGPVGVEAISATMGEDRSTVEGFIEPFLVRQQFIARSKSGRLLTGKGMEYYVNTELGRDQKKD